MIPPTRLVACLAVVPLLVAVRAGFSDDKKPLKTTVAPKTGKADKPTVKVEKGPFQSTVSVKGVFAAAEMTPVVLRPETWTTSTPGLLTVVTVVAPGTVVKKGDTLVTLQTDKIDRIIRELRAELKLGNLALRLAEEEMPVLEKSTPLELAAAERIQRQSEEDLKKFLEIDRPLTEATVNNSVKNSQHFVEYAKEELKQLQKMYRSKDLTEETEEIILKRQRHQVEMAEFGLKTATIRRDQTLKVDLPRQEQISRESAARQTLALAKAKSSLPLNLNQKRLALERLSYEQEKSVERLRNLEKDREMLTVQAPADGVVYHGRCVDGQWNSTSVTPKLQRGGHLGADEVFMTIVAPRPLVVNANVDEKDLHWLKIGAKGKAVPAGFPDIRVPVSPSSLSSVPYGSGTFPAVFKVDAAKVPKAITPGMACIVKVIAYRNELALTLPSTAVFSDDDEEHYVYKGGSSEKATVEVGKTSGNRTEILGGLKAGDEVLASKP